MAKKKISKGEILTELYTIRASIPLTQGKIAREMIKKLIDRLEKSTE